MSAGRSAPSQPPFAGDRVRSAAEWSRGWPVVLTGLIGMSLMSLHTAPLGILMKPLGELFGWSRSQISAGLTILTVLQCLLVPVIGLIIPRIGMRRIVLVGGLVYVGGLALLGFSGPAILTWYGGWAVLGLGVAGICPLIWTMAIVRAFDQHRGLALAVVLSGTGVANFVYPILVAFIFQSLGWRAVFFCNAAIGAAVILPLVVTLMRSRPEFDREVPSTQGPTDASVRTHPLEALSDRRVWQMLVAALMIGAAVGLFGTHLQAMLQDRGVSPERAAAFFAASGPALIVGRLLAGLLLDRLPVRLAAGLLFLIPGVTCAALLSYNGSAAGGIAICILFGLGYGAETDVFAYLTARYVGSRKYPSAYGLIYGVFGLSYGMAALLGGAAFDRFGSYANLLTALILGVVLAVILILALGPGPKPDNGPLTA